MQIVSGFTCRKLRSHRAKFPSVWLTDGFSKFNVVEWSHRRPQRQQFPTSNFCHPFNNIVSMNKCSEHFSANPVSRNYNIDRIKYASSRILPGTRLIKSYQSLNSHARSSVIQTASKQLWRTGSMNQKCVAVIRL
jgi:hypothetical protein